MPPTASVHEQGVGWVVTRGLLLLRVHSPSRVVDLVSLVKRLRPFFLTIAKARTAKIGEYAGLLYVPWLVPGPLGLQGDTLC